MEATQRTREYIGKLIVANAGAIKQHTEEIGDLYNQPVVAMDALVQAHNDLLAALDTASRFREDGIESARKNIGEIKELTAGLSDRVDGLLQESQGRSGPMKRITLVVGVLVVALVGTFTLRAAVETHEDPLVIVHWSNSHPMRDGLLPQMAEQFNDAHHETSSGRPIEIKLVACDSALLAEDLVSTRRIRADRERVRGRQPDDRHPAGRRLARRRELCGASYRGRPSRPRRASPRLGWGS